MARGSHLRSGRVFALALLACLLVAAVAVATGSRAPERSSAAAEAASTEPATQALATLRRAFPAAAGLRVQSLHRSRGQAGAEAQRAPGDRGGCLGTHVTCRRGSAAVRHHQGRPQRATGPEADRAGRQLGAAERPGSGVAAEDLGRTGELYRATVVDPLRHRPSDRGTPSGRERVLRQRRRARAEHRRRGAGDSTRSEDLVRPAWIREPWIGAPALRAAGWLEACGVA